MFCSISTTSPKFGCVNTARVFLAIFPLLIAGLTPRTKCGTALNFPLVILSSVSPVWKAMASRGILTCTVSPVLDLMYSPALGSGLALSSFSAGRVAPAAAPLGTRDDVSSSLTNMAEVRAVRQPWSRCVAHQSSSLPCPSSGSFAWG